MNNDNVDQIARGEELQFKTSHKQMALLALVSLVFAAIGVCMVGSDGIVVKIGGWLALIFFGLICLPIAIFRAIVPTVQLKVSNEGVWSRSADLWVPWAAIAMVDQVNPGGGNMLALVLKDEAVESVLGVTPEQRATMDAEEAEAARTAGEDYVPSMPAVPVPANLTISHDALGHLLASEVARRNGATPTA